jgi:hypothetical protein
MSLTETSDDCLLFNECIENATECNEKATIFMESALESLESMKLKIEKQKEELAKMMHILHTRHDQLDSVLRTFKGVFPSEESKKFFHTRFAAVCMSSTILPSLIPGYGALNTICGFPMDQNWMLLYRASVDGFGAVDFHRKCDGQINTLTIVKSVNGNIFGGYTNVAWESQEDEYRTGTGSFLFSFKNQTNSALKFNCIKTEFSINCDGNYGPTFGRGHDLFISNNSNANIESYSNPGNSYQLPPGYTYNTDQAKNLLAGSDNFKVNEIEVFTKA